MKIVEQSTDAQADFFDLYSRIYWVSFQLKKGDNSISVVLQGNV